MPKKRPAKKRQAAAAQAAEEHPRGTLTLVLVFAVLLIASWLIVYFGIFTPRG